MDWLSGENTGVERCWRLLCAGDGPRLQVRHRPQVQLVVGHVDEPRAVRGDGQGLVVDNRELLTLAERECEARHRRRGRGCLSVHAAAPTIALATTAVATIGMARFQSGRGSDCGCAAAARPPEPCVSNAPVERESHVARCRRRRRLRSFSQAAAQQLADRRGTVRAGSASKSGAPRRTAASVSDTSSPSNARFARQHLE